jgi:hypothetical protein
MANRCPDCNKFVSLEMGDPEVESIEVDLDGVVSGDVRLTLICSECGNELSEATISFEDGPVDNIENHISKKHADEENKEFELEVEETGIVSTDRYNTTDRKGKPIKSFRYKTHYYGFELSYKVTCSCGEEFDDSVSDEERAGSFEQLY